MELNKDNFDDLLKNKLVLVDFWAVWCGPCQTQKTIIQELDKDHEKNENIIIAECNIDDNSEIAEKYQIMSIPTMVLFKNGEEKERITGLQSKESLREMIDKYK